MARHINNKKINCSECGGIIGKVKYKQGLGIRKETICKKCFEGTKI